VLNQNLRCTDGITQEIAVHCPSNAHENHAVEATTIVKDATSVLKGLARRRLEAPCVTPASRGVSERRATSSSMMPKLTPASGWRTTGLRAGLVERMMIPLLSSSSQSIWLTSPEADWTICQETSLIVGTSFGRFSLATSRACT
jgi:hypothetical protein